MTAGGLVNRESDNQPTEMGKAAVAQAWGEGRPGGPSGCMECAILVRLVCLAGQCSGARQQLRTSGLK